MNEQLHALDPKSTQAAEGLPRRRWSVDEIRAMMEAGIILENERFELIGGEVVPMSPKGIQHEVAKKALQRFWFQALADNCELITETTLYIDEDNFLEPDFLFWPATIPLADITAQKSLLIVEVASTSLGYDLGQKADIYASIGLRELWVIDAIKFETHIFLEPRTNGYAQRQLREKDAFLSPTLLPDMGVTLADLL